MSSEESLNGTLKQLLINDVANKQQGQSQQDTGCYKYPVLTVKSRGNGCKVRLMKISWNGPVDTLKL
jgi:hypothetical protein